MCKVSYKNSNKYDKLKLNKPVGLTKAIAFNPVTSMSLIVQTFQKALGDKLQIKMHYEGIKS